MGLRSRWNGSLGCSSVAWRLVYYSLKLCTLVLVMNRITLPQTSEALVTYAISICPKQVAVLGSLNVNRLLVYLNARLTTQPPSTMHNIQG